MKTINISTKFSGCVLFLAFLKIAFPAQAGFYLGDAANYAVLYEGSGGHNLQINSGVNAPNQYSIAGNVGLGTMNGGNPQFQFNSPATINGSINFAASTANIQNSGGQLTGSINSNVGQVNADLAMLNTLSGTLAAESGTSLSINGTTTVNASSGTLDGNGNYVFSVAYNNLSLKNGQTLTINGSANQFVVLNFNWGGNNIAFGGNILLAGGISANQVLFNIVGGSTATLSGGGQAGTAANYGTQYATYLDPDGKIVFNSVNIFGHVFGGDSSDMQIVSGSNINAFGPGVVVVPEPAPAALLALSLGLWGILRARSSKVRKI